jgi:hypothetical protein
MLQFKQQMFSLKYPKFNVAIRNPFRLISQFREGFTTQTIVGGVLVKLRYPQAGEPPLVGCPQYLFNISPGNAHVKGTFHLSHPQDAPYSACLTELLTLVMETNLRLT